MSRSKHCIQVLWVVFCLLVFGFALTLSSAEEVFSVKFCDLPHHTLSANYWRMKNLCPYNSKVKGCVAGQVKGSIYGQYVIFEESMFKYEDSTRVYSSPFSGVHCLEASDGKIQLRSLPDNKVILSTDLFTDASSIKCWAFEDSSLYVVTQEEALIYKLF